MSSTACQRDSVILRSAHSRTGLGSEELRHVATCEGCQLALAADAVMTPLFRAPAVSNLPPAGVVLLRARLAARRRDAERALAPIALWRVVITVVSIVGAAVLFLGGRLTFSSLWTSSTAPAGAETVTLLGVLAVAALPFLSYLRTSRHQG